MTDKQLQDLLDRLKNIKAAIEDIIPFSDITGFNIKRHQKAQRLVSAAINSLTEKENHDRQDQ